MTMIRLLWLFLIAFLVFKLVRSLRGFSSQGSKPANHGGSKEGEELVKDPQCGAYFPRSEGVSLVVDGETRHFCSPACRDKFLQKK